MKNAHFLFFCFVAMACTFASAPVRAIDLPVEVAVGDHTTPAWSGPIAVQTSAGSPTAAKLWMRIHNLHYDGQASVRINSTWIDLANSTVTVLGPGADYGGIGGGYHTLDLELDLPAGSVAAGANEVAFRMNPDAGTEAAPYDRGPFDNRVASAFRVLNFQIRDANNADLITSARNWYLADTGPDADSSWITDDNPANIAAGKAAWENATLQDYPEGPQINAKCADCHMRSGRDLRYFGYNNKSIFMRSRFHGLSWTDARNLTRYIRSLTDAPTNSWWGRPWKPPYQPHPDLRNRDVKDWAAGGGLNAVLADDSQMHQALFPAGSDTQAKVDAVFDTQGHIDVWAIPVALQFPDWNHWLPIKYPGDIWDGDGMEFDFDFEDTGRAGADPYQEYLQIRNALDAAGGVDGYLQSHSRQKLVNELTDIAANVRKFISQRTSSGERDGEFGGGLWRTINSDSMEDIGGGLPKWNPDKYIPRETAKRSLTHWLSVKYFELMREFEIEERNADILQYDSNAAPDSRGWPYRDVGVFNNAPHQSGAAISLYEELRWKGQSQVAGWYTNTVWYQVQMTLNSGQGQKVNGYWPVDWEYQPKHLEVLSEKTGVQHPFRMVESLAKMYQIMDSQGTTSQNTGWWTRHCNPYRTYANRKGDTTMMSTLDGIEPDLWLRVNNAYLKSWIDFVNDPQRFDLAGENLDNWLRKGEQPNFATNEKHYRLWPTTYRPKEWASGAKFGLNVANGYWRLLPDLRRIGVDGLLLQDFKDWCARAWPGPASNPNDWDSRISLPAMPFDKHQVESVRFPGEFLVGNNTEGSQATLSTTPIAWEILPVSGSWFRLRKKWNNGIWLRANSWPVPVQTGTTADTGANTQWRAIDAGAGLFRIEVKDSQFSSQPWLYGTNSDTVIRGDQSINNTVWKFVTP